MPVFRIADHASFRPDKLAKNPIIESPRMFCDLYCLEPGQEQRPHSHEGSDKVYIVLEGEVVFTLGDDEHRLGSGYGVHAEPAVLHGVVNRSSERAVLLVIMAPKP